jgi:hypothetical protein
MADAGATTLPAPLRALLAAYGARDVAAVRAGCDPGVHYEDPLTVVPCEGVEALLEHLHAAWTAFPDGRLEPTGAAPRTGALVAAPVKLVATHRGPLGSLPATGRPLVAHAVLYCELDAHGERLLRARAFFDAYGAATQLGVLPQPGTAGQRALMVLQGFGLGRRPR